MGDVAIGLKPRQGQTHLHLKTVLLQTAVSYKQTIVTAYRGGVILTHLCQLHFKVFTGICKCAGTGIFFGTRAKAYKGHDTYQGEENFFHCRNFKNQI